MAIPEFTKALDQLRDFLVQEGAPAGMVWFFREDYYSVSPGCHFVRWPLPDVNADLAASLFQRGRSRGIVEISAHFRVGEASAVSVLAPAPDEIQGWSEGLKLSKLNPFAEATRISGSSLAWRLRRRCATRRLLPGAFEFASTRKDAVAQILAAKREHAAQ